MPSNIQLCSLKTGILEARGKGWSTLILWQEEFCENNAKSLGLLIWNKSQLLGNTISDIKDKFNASGCWLLSITNNFNKQMEQMIHFGKNLLNRLSFQRFLWTFNSYRDSSRVLNIMLYSTKCDSLLMGNNCWCACYCQWNPSTKIEHITTSKIGRRPVFYCLINVDPYKKTIALQAWNGFIERRS
jgi:hypothetical protein